MSEWKFWLTKKSCAKPSGLPRSEDHKVQGGSGTA